MAVLTCFIKHFFIVVTALLLFFSLFTSCSSSQFGRVIDSDGNAVVGATVEVIAINDSGDEIAVLETHNTDGEGSFQFDLSLSRSSTTIFQTTVGQDRYRAFASGKGLADLPFADVVQIDPISEAFVTAILYVTETENGRTLLDFTHEELASLIQAARSQLANDEGLDLSSSTSVTNALLTSMGRQIANAAGGAIGTASLSSLDQTPTLNYTHLFIESALRKGHGTHHW